MKLAIESNGGVRGVAAILCGAFLFLTPIPFENGKESASSMIFTVVEDRGDEGLEGLWPWRW